MKIPGTLKINPSTLPVDSFPGEVEVVVAHTETALSREILKRAVALTKGLNAKVVLLAVHAVPYPCEFSSQNARHSFLVKQLLDLAEESPLPLNAQVVLARSRQDGFREMLKPESTVLVGTRARLWRTSEERLARQLAADGHKVSLLHVREGEPCSI